MLLFSGAGVDLSGWATLLPRLERHGTVLAWNRPGLPGSDTPRGRQHGLAVVGALRDLLRATRLAPPYVLVAHSLGGLHAQLFARLHPEQVAGVLLIESTHVADRVLLKREEGAMVRSLAKVTGLRPAAFEANVRSELAGVVATTTQLAAAGPFPIVPLRVVTGGRAPPPWLMSPAAVGAKRANQQELARLSPLGRQVIAQRSGHFPQRTEPGLVLDVLRELLDEIRAG